MRVRPLFVAILAACAAACAKPAPKAAQAQRPNYLFDVPYLQQSVLEDTTGTAETQHLVDQLKQLGATQVILFGSLARGEISLFSDIDLLALFDQERPARELTRWVYQNIQSREAVDVLAFGRRAFQEVRDRPFFQRVLREGRVLYEGPGT